MQSAACITLSWDDGHPLDMRVAELMAKHGLRGTFYAPRIGEHETLAEPDLRQLGLAFEIGAHTLSHTVLTGAPDRIAWQEISGSKCWIEDVIGTPCPMFCPPRGRFSRIHLEMINWAGYRAVRTVELLSLDWPRRHGQLLLMPTTVQAWSHDALSYVGNAVKRAAARNLLRYLLHAGRAEWHRLGGALLEQTRRRGGVFHLWGHSWEVDACGGWSRLEEMMRLLGEHVHDVPALTNGEICRAVAAGSQQASPAASICPEMKPLAEPVPGPATSPSRREYPHAHIGRS